MTWVADVLNGLGITGRDHPTSFPDGAAFRIEIPSFVGPRERYGVGAHARSADGRAHGDQVRGLRQISYALEDVLRATEEGIRSFLVADLGLLRAVTQAQAGGALPAGLVWKVS